MNLPIEAYGNLPVIIGMQSRSKHCKLVPIDIVVVEEAFDLFCDLAWSTVVLPIVYQALPHAYGAYLRHLIKSKLVLHL